MFSLLSPFPRPPRALGDASSALGMAYTGKDPMGNSIRAMLNDLYGGRDSYTPMKMTEFSGEPKPPTFDDLYAQQRQRTIDRYGGLDKAIADLRERGGLGKGSRYYSGWERPKSGKERMLDTWVTLHPSEKSIPRKSDDEILAMLDQDWRKNADQELSIQARRNLLR